jgi:hypothetical protein
VLGERRHLLAEIVARAGEAVNQDEAAAALPRLLDFHFDVSNCDLGDAIHRRIIPWDDRRRAWPSRASTRRASWRP